eukprot:Hpha_TRINITY_DN16398_c0_g1::TRINITY_DN16398_c0_g1_i1::g.62826::m.62826
MVRVCCACTAAAVVLSLLPSAAEAKKNKHKPVEDENGDMVELKAELFHMGTDDTKYNKNVDGEGPSRLANVKPFSIDVTPVTNAQFLKFARDTKFQTEAEQYGWSFVLASLTPKAIRDDPQTQELPDAKQWLAVGDAWWRKPEGKGSGIKDRLDHPVVHIGYKDAEAYCKWAGKRLPTETEWEYAARGGLESKAYPWGDSMMGADGKWMMNVWQGKFFEDNTEEDGYWGTSPVTAFPPNGFGVYSAVGNVWEWTQTMFSKARPGKKGEEQDKMVLRGGSFVDSTDGSFNHKARVTTRMGNTPDSGSHNTGFRCARDGSLGGPKPDKVRGSGGKAAVSDPDRIQEIVAEQGVEGLQQYMKDIGMAGDVLTPDQVQKKQAEQKKLREREERMFKEMQFRENQEEFLRAEKERKRAEESEEEDEMDD